MWTSTQIRVSLGALLGMLSLTFGFPVAQDAMLGAIATEADTCSAIGIGIMKRGGNAADAIIAAQFCVGTIGMYHSGPGGGGFALVRSDSGEYETIDFRETAPEASFEQMFSPPYSNSNSSYMGGMASGVPGELRGLEYMHKKYATLPWKDLIIPSVELARNGFPVTEDIVKYMMPRYKFLVDDPIWAIDFAPNGAKLQLGETMTRERYANTLEVIAEHGADAFYTGAIANATINTLRGDNGVMTLDDLANYQVAIRRTLNTTYRGNKIFTASAPSSGPVVLSSLKIVEGFDMSTPSRRNFSTHMLDEAFRFSHAQRAQLGDPNFVKNTIAFQEQMFSEETAATIREKIHPLATLEPTVYNPENYGILNDHGTSALVTSDRSGLTIAMTCTINNLFGSRLMVPETGVIMNNQMNDFSTPENPPTSLGFTPTEANFIQPGKRPLSSISPVIVEYPNGTVFLAHASAGGAKITTEVTQHLWHSIDHGMSPAEALAEPRFHDQLSPNTVVFEYASEKYGINGFNNKTTAFFREIGADVSFMAVGSTTAQALRRLGNGTFEAASEPRQLNSGGFVI